MADITYNEFKKRVAHKLYLVADSEDVPAEYDAIIGQRALSVQAQLDVLNICTFQVEGGIEEAYSDAFGDLVAAECADVFDLPEPRRSQLGSQKLGMSGRSGAERRLRNLFISTKQVTRHDSTVV
jgi:hypothetical protein